MLARVPKRGIVDALRRLLIAGEDTVPARPFEPGCRVLPRIGIYSMVILSAMSRKWHLQHCDWRGWRTSGYGAALLIA